MLIWFDAFNGDQKVYNEFKSDWHIVCYCLGWFGVVLCGLGAMAYCRGGLV